MANDITLAGTHAKVRNIQKQDRGGASRELIHVTWLALIPSEDNAHDVIIFH
jgi:hypothetical protein